MILTIRRTLLLGIPTAILVIAFFYIGHIADNRLLDHQFETTTTVAPVRTVNIAQAEDDAQHALDNLTCAVTDPGSAAEAWAEVNSEMPNGYEVIAECVHLSPAS